MKKIRKYIFMLLFWLNRLLSLALIIFFLLALMGEFQSGFSFTSLAGILSVIFLSGMVTGLIAGWFSGKTGAAIILPAFFLFWLFKFILSGSIWIGWTFMMFPLIAVIHLLNLKFNKK